MSLLPIKHSELESLQYQGSDGAEYRIHNRIWQPTDSANIKGGLVGVLGLGGALDKFKGKKRLGDGWDTAGEELAKRGFFSLWINPPRHGFDDSVRTEGDFTLDNCVRAYLSAYNAMLPKFKLSESKVNISNVGISYGAYYIGKANLEKDLQHSANLFISPVEGFESIKMMKIPFLIYKGARWDYHLREGVTRAISYGANITPGFEKLKQDKKDGVLASPFKRYFFLVPDGPTYPILEELLDTGALSDMAKEKGSMKEPTKIFYCKKDGLLHSSIYTDDDLKEGKVGIIDRIFGAKEEELREDWRELCKTLRFA